MATNNDSSRPDDTETIRAVADQVGRMAAEGMVVPVDPDDAEDMSAFEEDALSAEDALDSRFDDVAEGE
jgi:maltose-binding protein MalE